MCGKSILIVEGAVSTALSDCRKLSPSSIDIPIPFLNIYIMAHGES
jgi:hypothetical protein